MFDPELNREIAIKMLRPGGNPTEREWLLREARAMARLSHPNVVGVLDVGDVDDQIFIAMELVDGTDLREWMTSAPRSWREVLDVFGRAGAGLAAAHDAGMVHGDFKPDNVFISEHGRVAVGDFGNAAQAEANVLPGTSGVVSMSRVGAGTPAYMAPEQQLGRAATPHADQFAFCVALWEALYGERPFRVEGDASTTERAMLLATEIILGRRRPPAPGRRVPGWLRRALDRGLATDPAARWPSMHALLTRLDPGRRRHRRSIWLAAMASGAAAAALAVAVMAVTREPAEPCAAPSARVDLVWGAARRSAIEHHLMACAPSLGDKRFAVVAKTIKGIASVGPLERCADATALQVAARPPIEPAEAADVQAIATEVQAIAIALRRGAVAGLNAPADAVIDRARVLAHAPPLVAALAARVNVAQVQQDVPHAIAFLRELALGDVGRIERAILLADVGLVDVGHLLFDTPGAKVDVPDRRDASVEPSPGDGNGERERIVRALDTCAGNPTRAARMLAMSRTTLVQRLQLYGIPRPQTPQ